MIKQIKEKIGYSRLKSLQKRRIHSAKAVNFDNVKQFGIVFVANDISAVQLIKQILSSLPKSVKVSVLGFFNSKERKDFHIDDSLFTYIGLQDLNWYLKPTSEKASLFITTEFDVLVNFCREEVLPINFILCQSKSKLIAGSFQEESFYDFMIMPGDNHEDQYLIDQIIRYLKMIKSV